MSAATVSNVRPDKTRKSALSPAALVAFKLAPAPIKTETALVLPSPAARSRGVFPSSSRYSMSAFASTAAARRQAAVDEQTSAGIVIDVHVDDAGSGYQPAGPRMAAYYASKAYVVSFSKGLARELKGSGVSVTALCPGPTDSSFEERSGAGRTILYKHLHL